MKGHFRRSCERRSLARSDRHSAVGRIRPLHLALRVVLLMLALGFLPAAGAAQELPAPPPGPQQVIISALKAACSQNTQEFTRYLLADSRRAFAALPLERQKVVLKRFSLTSIAGHALALIDTKGRVVVQCNTPAESVIFHLGRPQIDHNVAFIPVTVSGGENTNFGLVRQPDGWRVLSLGLLVFNVPAMIQEWQEAELQANQQATMVDLITMQNAIEDYNNAFGKWPDTLKQLGPAPANGVSPEHAQLLSARLASGTADGYRFRYHIVTGTGGVIEGFELGAVPVEYGKTGRRSFYVGIHGKLHAADKHGAPATAADPVISPPSESPSSP